MSWKQKDWLTALGVLGAGAAAFFTGGAAAPALAGAVGAAEGAGAASLGGALATGAAEGIGAANLGGALASGTAAAGAMDVAGAATPGILSTQAPGAAAAFNAASAVPKAGVLATELSSGIAPNAMSAAPGLLNPSDLAFTGSKLYNPATVGQTVPMSFPGGSLPDMGVSGALGGKSGFGLREAQSIGNMLKPKEQQRPQFAQVQAPFPRQPTESNEEILKRHMMMVDPVTYRLLYGG